MAPWPGCSCWFCQQGAEHPASHQAGWHGVTGWLMVAESLDPADLLPLEACMTCGHRRPA